MSTYFNPAVPLTGEITALLLGMQADSLVTTPVSQVEVTWDGLTGDKHAGRTRPADSRTPHYPRGTPIFNDRQISIVSFEELSQIAGEMQLPAISPEWLGANLLIHGLPNLTQLPPGSRLIFANGVVLYVTHYNTPCSHPGKVIQANYPERDGLTAAFVKAAQHRRGLVAVVDHPGRLNEGEVFQVFPLKYYEYQPERDRG